MKQWGVSNTLIIVSGMKLWGVGVFKIGIWDEMVGVGMKGMKGMN